MPDKGTLFQEWFDKGSHDLTTARLAFDAGGLTDTVVVLLQQAVEKNLKGYLLSKGWRLKKTHDLRELLYQAIEYNNAFITYLELARRLTGFYFEERYPSGFPIDYSSDEIAALIEQTESLIAKLKEQAGSSS